MQTLDPDQQLQPTPNVEPVSPGKRRPRALAFAAGALALVVVTAGVAYAVGASHRKTATVIRTVPAAPKGPANGTASAAAGKPAAATPACVQGAAAGSCNIDEAKALAIKDKPLDVATRAVLAQQLVDARTAAFKYPTVADARRGGMVQAGQFSPETGAHFIKYDGLGSFDPSNPSSYIYDGVSPTSKVIGLMYLSLSTAPPAGFAGPNDHWHRHTNTCVIFGGGQIKIPFAADSSVTLDQCNAQHGTFMRETAWMVHAWVVPGWESPNGVFSHENTDVLCADGTTKADSLGFCPGT
jgi:hypothetical protein